MWIICVFYYYSFWPLVLHTKKVTLLSCSRNSCIMCVHISWQVKNIGEKPRSNMVNQRTLTHAHQEALHSSLFVSYLYNYFKVSTDFGFPFREKTIKPCSPGLSGGSVRIISLQDVGTKVWNIGKVQNCPTLLFGSMYFRTWSIHLNRSYKWNGKLARTGLQTAVSRKSLYVKNIRK